MKRVMKLFHKSWITAAAGGFLLFALSGCNIIKDPKSLMETPQLSSDKESLISVINAEIKGHRSSGPGTSATSARSGHPI